VIRVVAVGKLKAPYYRDAVEEYRRRITRFAAIELLEVPDHPTAQQERRLRAATRGTPLVACDPGGKMLSSPAFARLLASHGSPCFVVGGPTGLSRHFLATCDHRLSLSALTFPHELARLVLMEQIYRGLAILKGHPYPR
jgi:23S rRNA (pseudouridine1915-N3)-methyltransferase